MCVCVFTQILLSRSQLLAVQSSRQDLVAAKRACPTSPRKHPVDGVVDGTDEIIIDMDGVVVVDDVVKEALVIAASPQYWVEELYADFVDWHNPLNLSLM
jgi:hypothetical protein